MAKPIVSRFRDELIKKDALIEEQQKRIHELTEEIIKLTGYRGGAAPATVSPSKPMGRPFNPPPVKRPIAPSVDNTKPLVLFRGEQPELGFL